MFVLLEMSIYSLIVIFRKSSSFDVYTSLIIPKKVLTFILHEPALRILLNINSHNLQTILTYKTFSQDVYLLYFSNTIQSVRYNGKLRTPFSNMTFYILSA